MDVHKEGGIKEDKKIKEKTTVKSHIVETDSSGTHGTGHSRHEETDVKRQEDKSLTEKVGDKVKGAGHAVVNTFKTT